MTNGVALASKTTLKTIIVTDNMAERVDGFFDPFSRVDGKKAS